MLLAKWTRDKKLEFTFLAVFSAVIIVLFYTLISLNGLILGNDSAVHLAKAQYFLKTGQIPSSAVGWIPPLFEIILSMLISFSGATDVGQMIFLEKVLAVTADWLLFISVYLVGSKFFNKKVGAVAAVFLSMCYPMYEINTWGGFTTVIGLAFLLLLMYYSNLAHKKFGYIMVTFFFAFAIVLNHQLTTFVAVVIMLPVMFLMLIKFKGAYLIGFVALILGGTIAFFAYYFGAIVNHLEVIVHHIFFGNEAYVVQIPYTSFQAFLLYYGFTQFLAIGGIGISYYLLKQRKKLLLFFTLMLSLLVPLFFAESHLFGFLLPFQWFTYYLTPPIVIFAAVCVVFVAEKLSAYLNSNNLQKNWAKPAAVSLILLVSCSVMFFHFDYMYTRVMQAASHNSTSDIHAYDAGIWLSQTYPYDATVVATIHPGDWFSVFSGKHVISQTYDWVGRNDVAESVLKLAYELRGPQTLVKAYETNGYTADENYVDLNQIWYRVSYSSLEANFLSFYQNGKNYRYAFSDLSRTVSLDDQNNPNEITVRYFNDQVALTQTILVQNYSYPIDVSWSIIPLNADIFDVELYLTTYLDLRFNFDIAQIPQLIDWINPWEAPSKTNKSDEWATVSFSASDLADHYVDVYDQQRQTAFAFYFTDLPDWGNIGALANHQIDAVRYRYDFDQIGANQTVIRQYQMLTLTKSSYSTLQPDELQNLFSQKFDEFPVYVHNYKTYIAENNIEFIVYDKTQHDEHTNVLLGSSLLPQLTQCQFLELVYSNSRYDIFKILDNYNQTQVWD